MKRYIDKDRILKEMREELDTFSISDLDGLATSLIGEKFYEYIDDFPAVVDVQLLSVVAEHIKNRIYETALNTTDPEESAEIVDIAERIDFWISELKE